MTNEELWQTVLAQIQFNVSKANFATWFRNTKILTNEEGKVLVSVENSFCKEWLTNKYCSLILKILRNAEKNVKSIDFIIKPEKETDSSKNRSLKQKVEKSEGDSQLPFKELTLDVKTNLNQKYSFDNFIVGGFNELAHAAASAVAKSPGLTYNPLFIYGGVGLGKTHLLQATGNKISELYPEKKIKYAPAERFITNIVEAIRNYNIGDLKKRLLDIDVLIIDDVQFFAGKEKSQEEFFHIFNELYHAQKQIILSSDRPPKTIPSLEERLRSRFEGGMIADIGMPDIETRIAILKEKCEEKNFDLGPEVLEYIATNITTNIRELEGALNRIVIFQKVNNKTADTDIAKKLLENIVAQPKKITSFREILKTVSSFYDISENDLISKTRRKEIVKPRQVAMYLLREELGESYPSIGRKFGGKDHTTIIYACGKVRDEIKNSDDLLTEINLLRQKLHS